MLNILDWDKPLIANGVTYANSKEAYNALNDFDGVVNIKLNVHTVSQVKKEDDNEVKQEYLFTLPEWLAKSNKCSTELQGTIQRKTEKAVFIDAQGITNESVFCKICGRRLTNENSKKIGIGPICSEKVYGIKYDANDLTDTLRAGEEIKKKRFQMWLPIGRIMIEKVK